jgi:hypothetical protein
MHYHKLLRFRVRGRVVCAKDGREGVRGRLGAVVHRRWAVVKEGESGNGTDRRQRATEDEDDADDDGLAQDGVLVCVVTFPDAKLLK